MTKKTYLGYTILATTQLFGKNYVWIKDVDGTIFLSKMDKNGNPVLYTTD